MTTSQLRPYSYGDTTVVALPVVPVASVQGTLALDLGPRLGDQAMSRLDDAAS